MRQHWMNSIKFDVEDVFYLQKCECLRFSRNKNVGNINKNTG